ncbi:MAG TPA: DUF4386 domain-containing protein [Dermatophilaceae bacterium]|nr:DUF4386 domain-containing protein [Dermatophilaceae bacterium]
MNNVRTERPTAVTVGVLYIVATAAGGVSAAVAGTTGSLGELAANRAGVLVGALALVVMAVACMGVAVMLYPILRRDAVTSTQQGLAVWYVGTRISEATVFLVGVTALLAALALGQAAAEGADAAAGPAAGAALLAFFDYAWIAGQTIFCVGAAMLYWLLLRSGRVPRWLALWGLVAAPLMLVAGFLLPITGDPDSAASTLLYLPMAVQEMVLAVWLIGRGFRPASADTSKLEGSPSWTPTPVS